ncbi:MAG: FAD binding domain-containing protein [Dehalococcoidia bacterium]|nr:FAD binding domain-containing protein [Dehalococcoidia bacterium]
MSNLLREFNHVNAKSLDEAVGLLSETGAQAIAGGTDLLGTMKLYILRDYPRLIVNLKTIAPSLDYITDQDGVLKIGALTKLGDIAKSDVVNKKWSALSQAAQKTASPHIREMGTIGGNICQLPRCLYFRKKWNRFDCARKGGNACYALSGENRYHSIFGAVKSCVDVNPSDLAPALVALNASVVTTKRTIHCEQFWDVAIPNTTVLAPDELVKEIQIPAPSSGAKSTFIKFALRSSIDFPIVNCAALIGGDAARICLNAVYNKPYRATKAEDQVKGKAIDDTVAELSGNASVQDAIALPFNKWKIQIAKTMVARAVLACK